MLDRVHAAGVGAGSVRNVGPTFRRRSVDRMPARNGYSHPVHIHTSPDAALLDQRRSTPHRPLQISASKRLLARRICIGWN